MKAINLIWDVGLEVLLGMAIFGYITNDVFYIGGGLLMGTVIFLFGIAFRWAIDEEDLD